MRIITKIFLWVLCLLIIFLVLAISIDFLKRSPVTTEEIIRDDEQEQAEISKLRFVEIVEKNKSDYVGRGAHAKGHACVKAYLDVVDDIEEKLQYGIFSEPGKRYKTWIRFSNANSNFASHHDVEKDAHGMAIKVLNVEQNSTEKRTSQDFLMADNPNFFSPDIASYNEFLASKNTIKFFFSGLNPFNWRFREFMVALETLKKPEQSPLSMQFYSNTAYKLGSNNIKFTAKPCDADRYESDLNTDQADFLRSSMRSTLKDEDSCFLFEVQIQNAEKNMPLEDPSIEWKETDSPFIPVASITIMKQEFDSTEQIEFCENLSFSPWNSLRAHQPLGQFNRIRQHVYKSSSDYRHEKNKTTIPTDSDW